MTNPWSYLEERYLRQILPVVAKLEVPDDRRTQIEVHARALANECTRLFFQDHPDLRHSGNTKAGRHLMKFHKALIAVRKCISELPVEATDAIFKASARMTNPPPDLFFFDEDVMSLAGIADVAHRAVISDPSPTKPKKPSKYVARAVAEMARTAYEELTGERATVSTRSNIDGHPAYGNFLAFVGELFVAVRIEARPEHFARQASRAKEKAAR
jgi:hypothetical protein